MHRVGHLLAHFSVDLREAVLFVKCRLMDTPARMSQSSLLLKMLALRDVARWRKQQVTKRKSETRGMERTLLDFLAGGGKGVSNSTSNLHQDPLTVTQLRVEMRRSVTVTVRCLGQIQFKLTFPFADRCRIHKVSLFSFNAGESDEKTLGKSNILNISVFSRLRFVDLFNSHELTREGKL